MDNSLLGRPVGPQKRFVEKYVGQVMMGIPRIWFILWAALVLVVGIFPTVPPPHFQLGFGVAVGLGDVRIQDGGRWW
jgi:hypothetical protein